MVAYIGSDIQYRACFVLNQFAHGHEQLPFIVAIQQDFPANGVMGHSPERRVIAPLVEQFQGRLQDEIFVLGIQKGFDWIFV